jgi:predicted metalloenzyme YecM
MREIAVATYADPSHYLRVNVKRFSSHSNRITAAVALNQAKLDIDTIAHRLRWQRESVAHYLRETTQDIGEYTASAIIGSQRQFC